VSQIDTKAFYNCLVDLGLDFFCGVPDSLLSNFCSCIFENTLSERNIITANEGNAVGMACGYHLSTGKFGVVYMQNSGEGNTVNPLMSIADEDVYSIPLLLIIGWRGEPSTHDEPQHVKQGKVTCGLLETMGIRYEVLDGSWESQISSAVAYMQNESKPTALIVRKGIFSDYKCNNAACDFPMTREDALKIILNHLEDDSFVVSTTGKTSREVFEIRDARGQGHDNDFLTVGGMGHTSSIAYGVAIGTKSDVYCIDGDGSFLMHMGALPVIAQKAPDNFKYIINNNGAHDSVGGQPTVALDIDVSEILSASGFADVLVARTKEELERAMVRMKEPGCRALVVYTRQGSRADLRRPTTTPQANKEAMMAKLASYRKP